MNLQTMARCVVFLTLLAAFAQGAAAEVAETKVTQVVDLSRRNEHPLQCTMEKE